MELNNSISFLLSKCHQKALAIAHDNLEEFNLTPEQAVALTNLFKKDGINQLQLGEMIQKDRTTVSGIVNRLVNLGYVTKRTNPSDKRCYLLHVTEKALSIKEDLFKKVVEINNQLTKDFTDQEREVLIFLLKKIRNSK